MRGFDSGLEITWLISTWLFGRQTAGHSGALQWSSTRGWRRGGDQEFKDILSYIASWRSTWSTWKIVSKKKEVYSWFVVVSTLEPSMLPAREAHFKASIQEGIQRSFNKVTNTEIPLPGCCDNMGFKFAVHFWVQLQLKDDIGRFLPATWPESRVKLL